MSRSGTEYRFLIALVMGGLALVLLVLLLMLTAAPVDAVRLGSALVAAGVFSVWVARRTGSARAAWGTGCFANGVLSIGVAVGLQAQNGGLSGRSVYMDDIGRAIGPLTHLVWAFAARLGVIALLLATVLFVLSYWFLGPPHRKA